MSVQAQEESPVTWDIEGWVKAALRNWANKHDGVQIVGHTSEGASWISIHVDGRKIASVFVRT